MNLVAVSRGDTSVEPQPFFYLEPRVFRWEKVVAAGRACGFPVWPCLAPSLNILSCARIYHMSSVLTDAADTANNYCSQEQ